MRIAIIISRLEELGPVKSIQALVNSLYEIKKIQIKLYYIDKTVDHQINIIVPVERLDAVNFRFDDYDIIHTNGIRPDFFAFRNRKKIKYHISTIRNFVFDDLSFTYNRLISWIFGCVWLVLWSRADKLVCVSEALKQYYEKWYSASKLEVIYNGISDADNYMKPDNDIIQAIEGFRSKGLKVLGTAAILTRRKGIGQILNMLVEVNYCSLVIIGNGKELINLQRLSEKLKIASRCFFSGFRSNSVKYFKYFDCFIMPSRSEGFGRALVEAVQQKVPVVCSDIDVFKELFDDGEVTFFKLDDKNSLIKALKTAMVTGINKAELAYTRFLNSYTDQLMAKHYYELYLSVL